MSKGQVKYGCNVTVYTLKVGGVSTQEFREGYKVVRFRPMVKIMRNSISPTLFFKLIRTRTDFDIIHAHSHLFFSTNICSLVRKIGSVPLVITTHGLIGQTAPYWFSNFYLSTIGKFTLKCADRIISYTEVEKETLSNLGIDKKKIKVIPNGVDTKLFLPMEKQGNNITRILWVGRFVPGKGVEYLIGAFNSLVKEYPDLKLLMIGEGPLKENIEQKVHDLGLTESISIKMFVPNFELPIIYQSSDVFVLPSLSEGVPRVILEAMACGIPIVCTELPQLTDIVKGCGLLVPLMDSQALAEATSKIISDTELVRKFGEKGRAKVVKDHSWENIVKKTIGLYEELI
jgi:glycosyltransferase involved in cell wall biosynthesis